MFCLPRSAGLPMIGPAVRFPGPDYEQPPETLKASGYKCPGASKARDQVLAALESNSTV